ncbi:hypothetical protein ACJX0J_028321, partial [Zea mays]
ACLELKIKLGPGIFCCQMNKRKHILMVSELGTIWCALLLHSMFHYNAIQFSFTEMKYASHFYYVDTIHLEMQAHISLLLDNIMFYLKKDAVVLASLSNLEKQPIHLRELIPN